MNSETIEEQTARESLQLEQRQDLVLQQLDDLNERIENLIDLYTHLRQEDRGEPKVSSEIAAGQVQDSTEDSNSRTESEPHQGSVDEAPSRAA